MQKKVSASKRILVKYDVLQEFDESKKLVYQWNSKPFF